MKTLKLGKLHCRGLEEILQLYQPFRKVLLVSRIWKAYLWTRVMLQEENLLWSIVSMVPRIVLKIIHLAIIRSNITLSILVTSLKALLYGQENNTKVLQYKQYRFSNFCNGRQRRHSVGFGWTPSKLMADFSNSSIDSIYSLHWSVNSEYKPFWCLL